MTFIFLFISQLMAMDFCNLNTENTIFSPYKSNNYAKVKEHYQLPNKRKHSQIFQKEEQITYGFLFKKINEYMDTLKNKYLVYASDDFIKSIEKLINKYPYFYKIIYENKNINEINYSEVFAESVKRRKLNIKGNEANIFDESFSDIEHLLATPVKVNKNHYYFPRQGLMPQGTPRRAHNISRILQDQKMPIYIFEGEETDYNLHHLNQKNEQENILFIHKDVHKEYHGTLHTLGKKSKIDRGAFSKEKKIAVQKFLLTKILQGIKIILKHETPPINEVNDEPMDISVGQVAGFPCLVQDSIARVLFK